MVPCPVSPPLNNSNSVVIGMGSGTGGTDVTVDVGDASPAGADSRGVVPGYFAAA